MSKYTYVSGEFVSSKMGGYYRAGAKTITVEVVNTTPRQETGIVPGYHCGYTPKMSEEQRKAYRESYYVMRKR